MRNGVCRVITLGQYNGRGEFNGQWGESSEGKGVGFGLVRSLLFSLNTNFVMNVREAMMLVSFPHKNTDHLDGRMIDPFIRAKGRTADRWDETDWLSTLRGTFNDPFIRAKGRTADHQDETDWLSTLRGTFNDPCIRAKGRTRITWMDG
jgi:hypothetical protein